MKRVLLTLLALALVAGTCAWFWRDELLLALVEFRAQQQYADVAPNRQIQWDPGPAQPAAPVAERPPNIVLILADDLGYNDISTFGGGVAGGRVGTPHIDQLAAEGAVFTRSYSGAGTCAPSRAMLMTGRYPTRTGFEFTPTPPGMGAVVVRLANSMYPDSPPALYDKAADEATPPFEKQGLPAEEVTVAEVLKSRGYHTVHIGKWHLGRENGMAPHQQGFDESLLMQSGLYLPEDDPDVVNARLDFDPIDRFLWATMGYSATFNSGNADKFRPGGYLTDYWTDEAVKVIRANRNRPFFLYLAHWGVHTPLQATRQDYEAVGDLQPHRLRVYAAMIRALDRSVGRVMAALEAEGLADNTLVLFTSDNGGPGYIGLSDINSPFRGWKITMFEGGIRVPLFVKWPARIPPGTRVETPVAHIDMMPTLAAAAGAEMPPGVAIDGRNLLSLATGKGDAGWRRRTLFWESGHYRVVRHADWKLQVALRPDRHWLFNLADDPTEQHNLAKVRPDKVAELLALLDEHRAGARAPLYPASTESPIAIDKTLVEPFEPGDEYIYWPN